MDGKAMNFVGIDPGKHGAIVSMAEDGTVLAVHKMPLKKVNGKGLYDMDEIVDLTESWMGTKTKVYLEKLHALPVAMGGSIANFERGFAMGWMWILGLARVEAALVDPRTWQKVVLAEISGDTPKERAYNGAISIWGECQWMIPKGCRKPHDGIIDAALICEYGRRQKCNEEQPCQPLNVK